MANRWGNSGNSGWLYFGGAPKSLQMLTAALKLKDTYSLEEKLWPKLDSILKSRDITLPTKVHLDNAMVFPVAKKLMLLNCGAGEDSWESLGLQGDPTSPSERKSVLSVHWKDWCWSWNSNTLATWCKELTHWSWERLRAGVEGDDRGWDGWMASLTQWRLVWVLSRGW